MRALTRQRFPWLLLAAVLVLWQWLGTVHRAAHAEATPHRIAALHAPESAAHPAVSRWSTQLFDGHQQDSSDCQLLDQLAHADGAPSFPAAAAPIESPPLLAGQLSGLATARRAALFEARGPPASR